MGGLRNPTGKASRELYVYVDSPELTKKIKGLEEALAEAHSRPILEPTVELREVVKEVVKEDASLISKLNVAYKEIAELRGQLIHRPGISPRVEIREVEKEVIREVVRIQRVINKRAIAWVTAAALAAGILGGSYIPKQEEPVKIEEKKPSRR